jgi:uncharacterized protein
MRISSLWIYPVKGLRGHRVERAQVTRRGLLGDRRFMVVDAAGMFVSQRKLPELVRVLARLEGARVVLEKSGEQLVLPEEPAGPKLRVSVWASELDAIEVEAGSTWLSRALGTDVRLVWMSDDMHRPVTSSFGALEDEVSFADAFPYLLASDTSLEDLNRRLDAPVTMERFRPNLVVEGGAPWAEDDMRELRVGDVTFAARKPCGRCGVVNVDPDTGDVAKEPLATLATFRTVADKVNFGVNLAALRGGEVRVGDAVLV